MDFSGKEDRRATGENENAPAPPVHTSIPYAPARTRWKRLLAAWAVVAAGLLGAACEEDVVAVLGTDRPFSMYGALTPQSDTQWVRVFPIEDRLEPALPQPLDARLTSTDLGTGTQRLWNDSLFLEENGQYAHVYWSAFSAGFGQSYRLEVTRSDGAASHVEVTVPTPATIVMPPTLRLPPTRLPVFIEGDVPNLIRIEVTYRYRYLTVSALEVGISVVSYEGKARRVPGGWMIDLMPLRDLQEIQREIEERIIINREVGLKLARLTLRLIVANAEWMPPGGAFDPEVLVQPGVLNNVENGFGFVGAGYRLSDTWVPIDTIVVTDAGRF